MVDITQATDTDISATVDAFSAAMHTRSVQLHEPALKRVLVALDRSNQGDTAAALADEIASRCGAVVERLEEGAGSGGDMHDFQRILDAAAKVSADLIVVPAPFGDDYVKLGEQSVGTTLDVLTGRASVPVLVVREPGIEPSRVLAHPLLPITPFSAEVVTAAGWILKLLSDDGDLRLLALVETRAGEEVAEAIDLGTADGEKLAGLRRPEMAGLLAALQRRAAERAFDCTLLVRTGDALDTTLEMANGADALLVVPRGDSRSATARAAALMRCSRNPVLIVN